MIGPLLMELRSSLPYTCPILAGASIATTFAMAVVDWSRLTTQAAGALGLAGLIGGGIVGGIVYAINRYDQVAIQRRKLWEDANKASLTAQMEESLKNQEKMRASLHQLRNDAQVATNEASELRDDLSTLRQQFMEVSAQLRETDRLLSAAHSEMRRMTDLLAVTEKDRNALRAELDAIRATQANQGVAIRDLQKTAPGSGDAIPTLPPV